jgi:ParB-like chromosome segregation protein Spo0J
MKNNVMAEVEQGPVAEIKRTAFRLKTPAENRLGECGEIHWIDPEAELKIHPIAYLLPMMSEPEWEYFKEDISKNGVRVPVVVYQDQIIDGRNRWKACQELKIKCPAVKWHGPGSVLDYIVSCNIARRHLTTSQRAALATEALPLYEAEAKEREKMGRAKLPYPEKAGRAREHAEQSFGVSPRLIQNAKKLKTEAPELFEQVKVGDKTINEAMNKLKEKEKTIKRQAEAQKGQNVELDKRINLRPGDFRKVLADIKPIDLILTDPPYSEEYLQLWEDLAIFAKDHLKEHGYLIAYSGLLYLPEVLPVLQKYLHYVWIFCLYHNGPTRIINPVNVINCWKPVVVFQKGEAKFDKPIPDYVISGQPEKTLHEWQQTLQGVMSFLEKFSIPGEMVCDPFSGAGTTALACKQTGRNFIGAEKNEETFNIAKARLATETDKIAAVG